ncbi:alpha/beta hydrolase fold protein [Fibrella aestuarina BUZ 2]|uniref:Alpha/beta hydrolase fold protein n=1 Tax=Fibrella aestuarina BUZ 2 TaxID=1166018 RepID=I0K9E2_9BACT|nr:alpha/beta hydrolase [Fibrella aestuarina]CCH00745.1 alpha/beta hydrolase fold protein [Fibrella aestuarina BUZ 2]
MAFVDTNQVRLHVVEAGPADGPLVILLHGFPEFWYGWRAQIDALAAAGYRVWAPDGRGYNLSDKPAGLSPYTIDKLVADVVGLIAAAGVEKATVVGHDWGAIVAWWLAITHPDRLERLVCLNVPHPAVMSRFLRRSPRQLLRSWYAVFFQVPRLPEWLSRLGNWWSLTRTLRRSSRPGTFTEADLATYRAAWAHPGPTGAPALRTMVNWYRAYAQRGPTLPARHRITMPTLLIWGVRDAFLVRDMAQPSIDLCDRGRLVFFENATHWVQHEEADAVNRLLIDFIGPA